ncbi:MAG: hypothetical protein DLM54_04040 [Acidimicrobiales bacterium]|nr:MAG: hypothetical protein DLM54_04040 [Acidimicrobiales bacterium]
MACSSYSAKPEDRLLMLVLWSRQRDVVDVALLAWRSRRGHLLWSVLVLIQDWDRGMAGLGEGALSSECAMPGQLATGAA